MLFEKYVGLEVLTEANFNYWEPSTFFQKGPYHCTAYMSYLERRGMNIVVIETRSNETARARRELFFGTFQASSAELNEPAFEEVRNIASRKNRIAGRKLEQALLGVVNSDYSVVGKA
ncbi:MAG: hypothetical protein HYT71_03635 [Candidatus Aenigmarchaeota archaeon]|nr:hypothetical protein [Candidatus Aenigmarchaeota archaeon]